MKGWLAPLLGALFAAGLVLTSDHAHACAGCRNPSLATSRGSEGPLAEGAFRLSTSLTGTTVHVVHEAGCREGEPCSDPTEQPLHLHDQHLYPVELRLAGEYGFNQALGFELQVPFRAVVTRVEYTTPDGQHYEPLDEGVHHRDETVAGPADIWLLLRVGGSWEKWWLAARPGVSMPVGSTQKDPFELGYRGLRHQHIQLGSGTFDPVLVLEASRLFDPLSVEVYAQGTAALYENSHGYRAPWRAGIGTQVGTALVGELRGALGTEVFHDDAERWSGVVRQDGNLGRTEILASARLQYGIGNGVLSLTARVPLWRDIVVGDEPPGTLSSPLILGLGYTHTFGDGP